MGGGWISPESIASQCSYARPYGNGFIASCPVHDDGAPSFRVSAGTKGTIMYCHAGCTVDDICSVLGISKSQLFYDAGEMNGPEDRTREALDELISRDLVGWRIESFEDVVRVTFNENTVPLLSQEVWEEQYVVMAVYWDHITSLPYPDAMRYSSVIKSGPLWDLLHLWWEEAGKPDWHTVTRFAFKRMGAVWMNRSRLRVSI